LCVISGRTYAAQEGLAVQPRTAEDTKYLVTLMDWLENNNAVAGMSRDARRDHLQSFALSVFDTADDQDRTGEADMDTAKCFYSAAVLFEALLQFGPHAPDIEQKAGYALWKVADIRRALKLGQKPTRGGPGDFAPADAADAPAAAAGAGADAGGHDTEEDALTAALSNLRTPGSSARTPLGGGGNGGGGGSGLSHSSSSLSGSYPPPAAASPAAQRSPAAASPYPVAYPDAFPPRQQQQQQQQYPVAYPQAGSSPQPPSYPVSPPAPAPAYPQQQQQQQQHAPAHATARAQPQHMPVSAPLASPHTVASAAASAVLSASSSAPGVTGRPDSAAPLTVTPTYTAGSRSAACKEADKLARHVSSSLNFDDVPTAIKKLQQALAALLPYEFDVPQY
jgi:vacuolar protein sorting-associated protein VTA1